MAFCFFPVVDDEGTLPGVDLHPLLGVGFASIGKVVDHGIGAIGQPRQYTGIVGIFFRSMAIAFMHTATMGLSAK